ncbi:CAP domain-containing protein [Albidovulum sediminicola]|uniref:CAP domain-containing protein n=1 Tax=Albidovulum sediminicola TaxID=2984331 RepID=A0ABT2YWJ0_9RHOB|nr:CAP domain-containing protein [Defluviimonas sp. WL0075]MCV2863220.1 CAP domain-containing protein [Defluviimonas sp. WL0075]
MIRPLGLIPIAILLLSACTPPPVQRGPDGKPLPKVYLIKAADDSRVTYSMVDSINTLRAAAGVPPLALNAELTAAAATHSRDMSVQNRPWHFGSDGSSPVERVRRSGYAGQLLGENISETYETEIETLSAWMDVPDTRAVVLDPAARQVGFAWFQEPGGKLWWTLVTGV